MAGRFSVEAVFKAVDRVTAPVSRMQNRVGRFTRSMGSGLSTLNRSVDKFSRGIRTAGFAVVASMAIAGGAMANVINVGAEFEQTLVNAATKLPGEIRKGTEAYEALEDAAREVGRSTEFTATQSAGALNFLAMAGFDAEQSIAALPGVVDLATVAAMDLALATDIATDSLGAFNMMTDDAEQRQKNLTRITDVFARATTRANLSVEQMFEAIKIAGPVGIAAGQSLETIATFASILADAGIKGTRASTGMKNIFLALNVPGTNAGKILRRLGVETANSAGKIRDAVLVFQDFSEAVRLLPEQQQLRIFDEIFGKIPIAAAINLTNAADRMDEFRETLLDATGTTQNMATIMRDTLQGRLNALKSAIEGVKISMFKMNEGPLNDTVERMTEWVRVNEALIATNVGEFMDKLIDNFGEIVKWMKIIGVGLVVFFVLSTVLKSVALVLAVVNLLMAANPMVILALIVAALIVGLVGLVRKWDDFKAAMIRIVEAVPALKLITVPIMALIGLPMLLIENWAPIKGFFSDLWGSIVDTFKAKIAIILALVEKVKSAAAAISGFVFGDEESRVDVDRRGRRRGRTLDIVSPQERVARSIEENRTTSTAEVTIRDETGRAEVTSGVLGGGVVLQPSGAF